MKTVIKYFEKGVEIKNPQSDSQRGDHEISVKDMASSSSAHPLSLHEILLPA
jgi:hypothetical protein